MTDKHIYNTELYIRQAAHSIVHTLTTAFSENKRAADMFGGLNGGNAHIQPMRVYNACDDSVHPVDGLFSMGR